jgi:hypothetical protein
MSDQRPRIVVHGTTETIEHLHLVHGWGFGDGKTLAPNSIATGQPFQVGQVSVSAIPSDHCRGAANFVFQLGEAKVSVLWDISTPPDPAVHSILLGSSLALIEANTDTPQPTGHVSSDELIGTIDRLIASAAPASFHGIALLHYGGAEDPGGMLADWQQEQRFLGKYPHLSGKVCYGKRGQKWALSSSEGELLVQLVNTGHAYWWEKRCFGQSVGGNTAALITHTRKGRVLANILVDCGFGTVSGLLDLSAFSWSWALQVVVSHLHLDHHAELQVLSELWCKRYKYLGGAV